MEIGNIFLLASERSESDTIWGGGGGGGGGGEQIEIGYIYGTCKTLL